MGPGDVDGGPGRARLGHRAGVRRVHAVPCRPRLHGALDRAHAPLARPLRRLARGNAPDWQLFYGIVQGGVFDDLREVGRADRRQPGLEGSPSAGRSAARRSRCAWLSGRCGRSPEVWPRHLLGIGDVDDILARSPPGSTRSTARRRPGWPARTALVPIPRARWRHELPREVARIARSRSGRLPMPGVPRPHPRLHPLSGPREGADGRAPGHAAQPNLHVEVDGWHPKRDRGRESGRVCGSRDARARSRRSSRCLWRVR